jgi:5-methylcytosine-specific restriction enzyme subunit McrC
MALLPSMAADLVLDSEPSRRIVLDTKFTNIVTPGQFGGEGLKSAHIYQLYAYLRSQTGKGDPIADCAEGILLHPAVDRHMDEAVTIQGHRLRFITVDLTGRPSDIRAALLNIVALPST